MARMTATTATAPRAFAPSDLAHVAVFAALLAALSLTPAIPLGSVGVPITLQTLGVALAGLCLGPWRGFAAVALYVIVGLAGLPVFAGGAAGPGVLAGPTAGYLLSFPFAALVAGFAARWAVGRGVGRGTVAWLFLGVVASRFLVILPLAVLGLMRALGVDAAKALAIDVAYWPGDLIKAAIAALLAAAVHKAFPRLLRR